MEEKLKQIMQQLFKVSEITENASFTSIEGWDSLNHLNLIQILEQTFSVTFETDEIIEMLDYKTIVDTLKKRGTTF
jgi:acyl carrier protein|tara:strand:- start:143 stop:370 length:228 start_codon:yes stop_codon:yes gene_type:complete